MKGFTLIELLVVVLIIGILSAVALPQYQLAVDKSRLMPYLQTAHSIRRAEEVYYLANGSYTSDLGSLDIDHRTGCTSVNSLNNEWQCPNGFFIDLVSGAGQSYGAVRVALCPENNTGSSACYHNAEVSVTLRFEHSTIITASHCLGSTARGKRLCKALHPELLK